MAGMVCQRRFRMCQGHFRLFRLRAHGTGHGARSQRPATGVHVSSRMREFVDICAWLPYNLASPTGRFHRPIVAPIPERSRSMLNLAMLLEQSARREPGKVALIFDDIQLRYAELNGAANKIANGLVKLGVEPGDKVALMVPNTPHFVICYYAILKAGGVVVPLNVLFKRHEVEYHLNDSDASALIVWEGFLGEAAEGFSKATNCRNLIVAQAPGSTAAVPEGALPLNALMADTSPAFDTVPTMPDDTAVRSEEHTSELQ